MHWHPGPRTSSTNSTRKLCVAPTIRRCPPYISTAIDFSIYSYSRMRSAPLASSLGAYDIICMVAHCFANILVSFWEPADALKCAIYTTGYHGNSYHCNAWLPEYVYVYYAYTIATACMPLSASACICIYISIRTHMHPGPARRHGTPAVNFPVIYIYMFSIDRDHSIESANYQR